MIQDFKVKPLFEGQFHERYQFSVDVKGHNYHGIFHNEEIKWFHPQPRTKFNNNDLQNIEAKVHNLMTEHVE